MHQFIKFIFGIKLYMFRTVPLSIIRSFSLYTQQWYMSVFHNRRTAARYRALASIIPDREGFSWNLSILFSKNFS